MQRSLSSIINRVYICFVRFYQRFCSLDFTKVTCIVQKTKSLAWINLIGVQQTNCWQEGTIKNCLSEIKTIPTFYLILNIIIFFILNFFYFLFITALLFTTCCVLPCMNMLSHNMPLTTLTLWWSSLTFLLNYQLLSSLISFRSCT